MSFASPSPPPLRHPVPTHPAQIPEPPLTPGSPSEYQRFSSSPAPPDQHQQQQHQHQQFYGGNTQVPAYGYAPPPLPPQQFTSPFQHNSGNQQQQQHPQQQQAPPDLSAWGVDGMTTQLGMQFGSNALSAGQQYVQKNFAPLLPTSLLKPLFNVSNYYVLSKLRVVLFPWSHKPWSRRVAQRSTDNNEQVEFQTPREDINAPDLYIPLMSITTYILLSALQLGLQAHFRASVLGDSASRALVVIVADFIIVKIGCFLLNVQQQFPSTDLLAYGGYKFVGVNIYLLVSLLLDVSWKWSQRLVFVYVWLAMAFFLLRSMRSIVLPSVDTTSGTAGSGQRRRRITFLFVEAVTQVFWMGVLVSM